MDEMTGEVSAIERAQAPATPASLGADLAGLGVIAGDVVIVHASLSAMGWVAAGAQSVVDALLATVGSTGTIVMPTHSGQMTDPAKWSNPPVPEEWHSAIRDERPLYDPTVTQTRGMGQVVECFRTYPDSQRSAHPFLSFTAIGPEAERIVGSHPLTDALGETSPLARLYELDAKVALLGVGHGNNTSLHLAEYRATWGNRKTCIEGVSQMVGENRRWVEYVDLDHDESDFGQLGDAWAATGAERVGSIGAGQARVGSQRSMVDFAVTWIEAHR